MSKPGNKALLLIIVLMEFFSVTTKAQVSSTYTNPVKDWNMPDPSLIRGRDNYFYAYTTQSGPNLPIYRSRDLVTWDFVGDAFPERRPNFVKDGGIWAPEIARIKGQYVIYYAMSTWGGEWACGIGVATSKKPQGPFKDHGKLFISSEIGVQNSIDPCHFTDVDGRQYLFWGSFHGIYGIELDKSGLKIKDGASKFLIAPTNCNGVEATMIFKRGKYYYFMASAGSCCEGDNSTYHVVVARSRSIKGPYVNKNNGSIIDASNPFTTIMTGNELIAGPGHNSELIVDDNGAWWMLYHGFVRGSSDKGRVLFLDQVKWDQDGWPYIEGGVPSSEAERPYFKRKN